MRLAALAVLLAGCASAPAAPPARTPETLVAAVRQEARDEEWSALYRHLTRRRRDETERISFVLGISSQTVPPPHGYRIVDLVAKGSCDGILESPDRGRAVVYYSYAEPGKPRYDAAVLILREEGEWRIDGLATPP